MRNQLVSTTRSLLVNLLCYFDHCFDFDDEHFCFHMQLADKKCKMVLRFSFARRAHLALICRTKEEDFARRVSLCCRSIRHAKMSEITLSPGCIFVLLGLLWLGSLPMIVNVFVAFNEGGIVLFV